MIVLIYFYFLAIAAAAAGGGGGATGVDPWRASPRTVDPWAPTLNDNALTMPSPPSFNNPSSSIGFTTAVQSQNPLDFNNQIGNTNGFNGSGSNFNNFNNQSSQNTSPLGDLDEFDIISNRNKPASSPQLAKNGNYFKS